MTFTLRARGVRGVVLDIEGTTTPLAFVSDVLFPFARAHLRTYLAGHAETGELREVIGLLRTEWAGDAARGDDPPPLGDSTREAGLASLADYVEWLMDCDRKSPGLKLLQGLVWRGGYEAGALHGDVFADVGPALERWRSAAIDVAIYSSGSALAQRLLFGSTAWGDLTRLIGHFFDTSVGPKTAPASYARVAGEMGFACGELLFVSDVVGELDAARAAGFQALLCIRPGNTAPPEGAGGAVFSFDEIVA